MDTLTEGQKGLDNIVSGQVRGAFFKTVGAFKTAVIE